MNHSYDPKTLTRGASKRDLGPKDAQKLTDNEVSITRGGAGLFLLVASNMASKHVSDARYGLLNRQLGLFPAGKA